MTTEVSCLGGKIKVGKGAQPTNFCPAGEASLLDSIEALRYE